MSIHQKETARPAEHALDSDLPAAPLLCATQRELQRRAIALRASATVERAVQAALDRLKVAAPMSTPDGIETLPAALEELVHGCLLFAVNNDPAHPHIVWSEHLPYVHESVQVPSGRYGGDNPDRIYRSAPASSEHCYRITGKHDVDSRPIDFTLEAIPFPSLWGKALTTMLAEQIDIEADGSFTIMADSSPSAERRNHLHLPVNTAAILFRDTLSDWRKERPHHLSIRRIDNFAATTREVATEESEASSQISASVDSSLQFLEKLVWNHPPNDFKPFLRRQENGIPGSMVSIDRFSLKDDEALLVTLNPCGAKYRGFELIDPWLRSVPYDRHLSSLGHDQALQNADGSITYIIAKRDPQIHNWLDTGGLNEGVVVIRWEVLPSAATADDAVAECRIIKFSDIESTLPACIPRITPVQRSTQLRERLESYRTRLSEA